jgi:hypothetical protein
VKKFKAITGPGDGQCFYVVARTLEAAKAEAANVAARLFLEFGLVLKIQKVVEVP